MDRILGLQALDDFDDELSKELDSVVGCCKTSNCCPPTNFDYMILPA
jgi:hypothetical protein